MAETKTAPRKYTNGTGRRKTSSARVDLRPGTGAIVVNRKAFDAYFPN